MTNSARRPNVERVIGNEDRLGETPLWCDRTRTLWWIDIEEPKIQSFDPSTGEHSVWRFDCASLGSLGLAKSGGLLVAQDLSLFLFEPRTGALTSIAEIERDVDNRLNDGRTDGNGRFWVGSMDNELSRPTGTLYRVDRDGSVSSHVSGIIVTNGIAFSPDNRTMYLTDTRRFTTWAFTMDPTDGTITDRRVFADHTQTGDRPDGACVDVDGCLWTAFFAGSRIVRYRPDGGIDRVLPLPVTNPTCVCFGGTDYTTLYVTTARKFLTPAGLEQEPWAGSLLAIEGVGQGLREHRFG